NAGQRAAIHAVAEPRVRRWTGVRVVRWAAGLAAAGLIVAAALTPSLLRSRQAANEAPVLTAQNFPEPGEAPAPPVQPAQPGAPPRLKSQPAPPDSNVAPQVVVPTEIAPELQAKEDELRLDFAKDVRREADSERLNRLPGVAGGVLN